MRNLYEVLGVPKTADQATIRKAYKKLARQYHPDLNKETGAADRFKEISAAYEVLEDEGKRALYDEFGEQSLRPGFNADQARQFKSRFGGMPSDGGGFGGGGVNFEDLFGNLFGGGRGGMGGMGGFGGGGPPRPAAGADVENAIQIGLMDAVRGNTLSVGVRRPSRCAACNGEGGTGRQTCARCNGQGRVRLSQGPFQNAAIACDDCGGSGSVFSAECGVCAGTGRSMVEEHLKVHVPPGVTEGQTIRLRGKGGEGRRGGPPGDLLLRVEILPHPFLKREGADLSLEVPLTLSEAMAGGRVEVPTPDGSVRVNVPAGATNGQRLRLRGKGVPTPGGRGDLYLVLRPTPPSTSDPEALKLAEALAAFYKADVRADLKL